MSLYDDLVAGDNKKSVHGFCAGLRLWQDGGTDRAGLEAAYDIAPLDPGLDFLKAKYDASVHKTTFIADVEGLLILAEERKFGLDDEATFIAAVSAIG